MSNCHEISVNVPAALEMSALADVTVLGRYRGHTGQKSREYGVTISNSPSSSSATHPGGMHDIHALVSSASRRLKYPHATERLTYFRKLIPVSRLAIPS